MKAQTWVKRASKIVKRVKKRKTIGGKTFGELLEDKEWKPSTEKIKR